MTESPPKCPTPPNTTLGVEFYIRIWERHKYSGHSPGLFLLPHPPSLTSLPREPSHSKPRPPKSLFQASKEPNLSHNSQGFRSGCPHSKGHVWNHQAAPGHFYRAAWWDQGTVVMPAPCPARSPYQGDRPRGADPKKKATEGEAADPSTPAVFWWVLYTNEGRTWALESDPVPALQASSLSFFTCILDIIRFTSQGRLNN